MILKNPALISSSVSAFYTNISNRAVKTRMDISTISLGRVRHIVGLDGESDSPIDKPDVRTSRGLANKGGVDGNVVLHI